MYPARIPAQAYLTVPLVPLSSGTSMVAMNCSEDRHIITASYIRVVTRIYFTKPGRDLLN
jgi:hypothetical protein